MRKEQIKSILDANQYLISCKLENPNGYQTKFAQKYLTQKINEILSSKKFQFEKVS